MRPKDGAVLGSLSEGSEGAFSSSVSETDSDSDSSVLDWSQDSVFFREPALRRSRGVFEEEDKDPGPAPAADCGCSAMKISVTTEEPRIFGSNMYEQFSQADERLGPRMAIDKSHNFHMYWRFHSFPIHGSHGVVVRDVKSIETIETYVSRLKAIRAAIRRLHERHPGSKVVLKSVNTREHKNLSMLLQTSNWYAHELNNILREVFSGEENVKVFMVETNQ
uniref:NXPE C-terminal domain-containing protein n=1 Tax=Branchiostoma floridae TaxID=7739 RepID=C3YW51_BRAFL|eukprot:XP_002599493.1 hypothetical protein BRAFLDRAFT_81003 [Branchiostoma floridae]